MVEVHLTVLPRKVELGANVLVGAVLGVHGDADRINALWDDRQKQGCQWATKEPLGIKL